MVQVPPFGRNAGSRRRGGRPGARLAYVETYGCQHERGRHRDGAGHAARRRLTARTETRAAEPDMILSNTCACDENARKRVFARARQLPAARTPRAGRPIGHHGTAWAEQSKGAIRERALVISSSGRRLPAARSAPSRRRAPAGAVDDTKREQRRDVRGPRPSRGMRGSEGHQLTIQRGCDKF